MLLSADIRILYCLWQKKVKNKLGKDVIIGQTGKSGLNVGIIELTIKKNKKNL